VWGLKEAVERTMLWYRRQADGEKARALCEEEIEDFFQAE
jgi:CDP-glucose 4,6-dehydratase